MLLKMSLSGGSLIVFILVLRFFALNKLPKKIFFILWMVALLRLLVPCDLPFDYGIASPVTQTVDKMYIETEATDYPVADTQTAEAVNISVSSGHNISSMEWEWLSWIWILVMIALLVFFGVQYYREYKKMQTALPIPYESKCYLKMLVDVPDRVRLLSSDRIFSPLTFGMIFPAVIFPKIMDLGNEANARYVLTHEVIHIKRADNFWKIVMLLALCIHWFNPCVWMMWIFFNRDIELSCDEKVIEIYGENEKKEYARALIEFAEKQYHWMLFSNRFGKSGIQERMDAIMKFKKMTIVGLTMGILLLGAAITAFAQNNSAALESETGITQDKSTDTERETETTYDVRNMEEGAAVSSDTDTDSSDVVKSIAGSKWFPEYERYGLSYNAAKACLLFENSVVGYFHDEISENTYVHMSSGADTTGKIGVRVQRDSSYKIIGIEKIDIPKGGPAVQENDDEPDELEANISSDSAESVSEDDADNTILLKKYESLGVKYNTSKEWWEYNGKYIAGLIDGNYVLIDETKIKDVVYCYVSQDSIKEISKKQFGSLIGTT